MRLLNVTNDEKNPSCETENNKFAFFFLNIIKMEIVFHLLKEKIKIRQTEHSAPHWIFGADTKFLESQCLFTFQQCILKLS